MTGLGHARMIYTRAENLENLRSTHSSPHPLPPKGRGNSFPVQRILSKVESRVQEKVGHNKVDFYFTISAD